MFIKKFYVYLMEKYHWTEKQIDEQDFFSLLDLEAGEWKEQATQEPVVFIDELGF